ncbi:MAG: LCP family protein [Streptococcaceae bacterium]|jgi:LCP family protein required for cell wall assembly|nr:LCP family protein [Streptococcaceae bacterium]MCH4176805.1 LCP family protein [Streptococcaceae bacterium]
MSRIDKYKNYRDNIEKRIDDRQPDNSSSRDETSNFNNRYENKEYYQEEKLNPRTLKKNKKKKPKKKRRWWKILLLIIIILIGVFVYLFLKGKDKAESDVEFKKADVETFNGTKSSNGATNILILGTDQRDGQSNGETRSDTIMVMQINGPDDKVKLISFMRDTLVHIPGVGTEGYTDSKINSAYTIGEQNDNQGAELLRQTINNNFGIDMQYYALINFSSFEKVINTLFPDGVTINAKFSTVDGQEVTEVSVPDDLNTKSDGSVPQQTIKVGKQKMDGRTLLNYARFRKDDEGDYGRVQRQQQVLTAIIDQVKNPATLFTGSEALGTIYGYTSTNIDTSFILSNGLGILNQARKGIERMTVPENGDWTDGYDMYYGLGLEIDYDKYIAKINDFLDQESVSSSS